MTWNISSYNFLLAPILTRVKFTRGICLNCVNFTQQKCLWDPEVVNCMGQTRVNIQHASHPDQILKDVPVKKIAVDLIAYILLTHQVF